MDSSIQREDVARRDEQQTLPKILTGRRPEVTATIAALIVTAILVVLIYLGSRGFRDFDSALIGYAVATVFAVAAYAFRYTLWIMRPPTWRYFKAGWTHFLSWRNFRQYALLIPKAWWTDIFGQTFIRRRGLARWVAHMCIFWGCILSFAITIPLTFGWIRFTLVPTSLYQARVFNIPVFVFPIESGIGFMTYHALNFTGLLVIIGVLMALWRRITDAGVFLIQRFGFDLVPLVLLFAVAVTGSLLTASSLWWDGAFYWYLSLTHQVVVVVWLFTLPFGKFFHIIQRPASIGVSLYQTVNQDIDTYGKRHQEEIAASVATVDADVIGVATRNVPAKSNMDVVMPKGTGKHGTGSCKRCGQDLPSEQFIKDLQGVLSDLGQNYQIDKEPNSLQNYCPTCKRVLRGTAYYELMGKRFL